MINAKRLPVAGGLIAIGVLGAALLFPLVAVGRVELVTICHATGLDGTDHFVTLVIPAPAAFGNGGHFDNGGTPRAGHEGDYLGPCIEEETLPTEPVETTSTSEPVETTTTTEPVETTTTTEPVETTSTSEPVETTSTSEPVETTTATEPVETTTTTEPLEAAPTSETPETTTTTLGDDTTTDTVDSDGEAVLPGGDDDRDQDPGSEVNEPGSGDPVAPVEIEVEALPFTGARTDLVFPASLLIAVGAFAVLAMGWLSRVVGDHVADDADRVSLGLHRGRHETTNR